MKKFTLIAAIICSAFCFNANAQLTVLNNGQIEAGIDPEVDIRATLAPAAMDTLSAIRIFGPTGHEYAGRISFGDQLTKYFMHVLMGELEKNGQSTDRAWIHGMSGFYLTNNPIISDTLCYYDNYKGDFFKFNTNVVADNISIPSDSRFKENISPIDGALVSLKGLSAISYNLKQEEKPAVDMSAYMSESDARDAAFFEQFEQEKKEQNQRLRFGFLAQELKETFPNLVITDKDGYMYVDYIGLIPILVNAVNELSEKVEQLEGKSGENPQNDNQTTNDQLGNNEMQIGSVQPKLYQNSPNPFNSETVIRYVLPESVQNANLYIYDLQGKQLMNIAIEQRGDAKVAIHGNDLQAGMYIYALIADGKEIDSKRMILTK